MNTVNLKVPHGHIGALLKDLRRLRIKHMPFRRVNGGLEMDLYPNQNIMLLLLKYDLEVFGKTEA